MSLSRPVKFSLLKLPWLCIDCIIKCCDIFDIICFAVTSKRTSQIVKSSKIPLNRVEVYLTNSKHITLGNSNKNWVFNHVPWFEEHQQHLRKNRLVLQKKLPVFGTCFFSRTNDALNIYTLQNLRNALKMAMEFLNEVFKCSVEKVAIHGDNLPESGDIGVKSTVKLSIDHSYGYAQGQKLNLLLENLEVTGTCAFWVKNLENSFYVDPKLFKCRKLMFSSGSAAWITRKILLQFEVPRLKFEDCLFSVKDVLSFVTNWFHSDNKKLEYLYVYAQSTLFPLETFQTVVLNPVPFRERNREPSSEYFRGIDFSKGLEIVRHDGLVATIHVTGRAFLFYIWHDQIYIWHDQNGKFLCSLKFLD